MARQTVNIGASANDGSGDSLREGAEKINSNFGDLYNYLGGDSDMLPANRVVLHRNIVITSSQALPTSVDYYIFNSGTAISLTLVNGIYTGEVKSFTNRGAGAATVTPSSFGPGTSFSLPSNAGCNIVWDGTGWYLLGGSNVTIA